MKPSSLRALKLLLDSEDKEIVCSGREAWIGLGRISKSTVYDMLRHMMITQVNWADEIYIPTSEAEKILKRPALADEILARVMSRKPFFVDDAGYIQDA